MVDCERLKPTASHAIFKLVFIDSHSGFALPKGYSVVAKDGKTRFALPDVVIVERGISELSIALYCTDTGSQANGFAAGDIVQIASPMREVVSAVNTTVSIGGNAIEDDVAYANRIYLAPSAWSVAGSFDAYEYFALSAHSSIDSVAVLSPTPNHIDIHVLMRDNQQPTPELLALVESACNGQKRRPIGDVVRAIAAEPVFYATTVHVQIYSDMQSMATSTVDTVRTKVNTLLTKWQRQLGRDVVPQSITAEAQVLNAVYLATTPLAFHSIAKHQYPVITLEDVTFEIVNERTD
ncbi:baseplate J/gp47 family protein [Shewanella halifaxensis]|uniref:baseplate J/gp47 family protein n=1 Tax=Shewanella halifaxensis TaxID=271098 RepID=UPI000D59567C|nr:baseplate J/gp47 family protein [Shewanella halifaxensis]